ncbi:cation diffusion facilitator family transporter [Cohaesibacter celericrescens]|uniref:Protein p34 n=1 Tax=Cohaesibacter celericrescens TaxID=2067669 RepID=A0A2N5XRC0_9HYPH|nr:cation diffusion facilitator family transporter [Cohaesibacter celericrescens]PLW77034.1 cation-efflux pump [Cohaesibacter celericrescens]
MTQSKTYLNTKQLAIGSVLIALSVLALKYTAYAMTNSVGLYSDALESLVNLAAAVAVVIAVWMSEKPADHNHPYGHHKAEYLSAVLEGVMIVLAAIAIFMAASESFFNPRTLNIPILGLLLNGLAGVLNGVWAAVLIHQGRRLRSPALVADGKHLLTDVFSSVGVLIGVLFALWTGLHWLDPLLAIFVAASILWTGWGLIRGSVSGLMDEAVDDEELARIQNIIMANADGAIEAHDLRTRHAGRVIFVEFHLVVPSILSVFDAHEICDQIEHALMAALPHANVTIHIEPEDKAHAPHTDGSMVF